MEKEASVGTPSFSKGAKLLPTVAESVATLTSGAEPTSNPRSDLRVCGRVSGACCQRTVQRPRRTRQRRESVKGGRAGLSDKSEESVSVPQTRVRTPEESVSVPHARMRTTPVSTASVLPAGHEHARRGPVCLNGERKGRANASPTCARSPPVHATPASLTKRPTPTTTPVTPTPERSDSHTCGGGLGPYCTQHMHHPCCACNRHAGGDRVITPTGAHTKAKSRALPARLRPCHPAHTRLIVLSDDPPNFGAAVKIFFCSRSPFARPVVRRAPANPTSTAAPPPLAPLRSLVAGTSFTT